jgi:hypothetical protein
VDLESVKYDPLLCFFYTALSRASKNHFQLFRDFLAELKIDEERIKKYKIKDEILLDMLADIYYSKKIKKSLKEYEPPLHIREYIAGILAKLREKIKEYFAKFDPAQDAVSVKEEFGNHVYIKAGRRYFLKDDRVLPSEDDAFSFEWSAFYRKEAERLEISFSTRFKVKEEEVPGMDSSNMTIFDKFAEHLGLAEGYDKSVQFDAIYSDGETLLNNTCEVYWLRTEKM